ncbi:MAG TPA: glutathione S-transferase [Casimicrobiaceae bacterium]|jgi:glutathione S-transferase
MKLFTAATSPYARKVRIVLVEKKIDCEYVDDNPWEAQSAVPPFNPLGKIPVLVLDDGTPLYDSRVIVGYLDTLTPVSRLIPGPSRQRIAVRRWEALADGVCDAALTALRETKRPAQQQSREWIARQLEKIRRGVAEMSSELGDRAWCSGDAYTLADIATGCALGYLDLRHPSIDWRGEYPNLVKHAEKLGKRASFVETAPPA